MRGLWPFGPDGLVRLLVLVAAARGQGVLDRVALVVAELERDAAAELDGVTH